MTMSKKMAERYRLAEQIVWNHLDNWKKTTIKEDRLDNPESRHITEFAKEVIKLAESDTDLDSKISGSPTLTVKDGKFYVTQSNQ